MTGSCSGFTCGYGGVCPYNVSAGSDSRVRQYTSEGIGQTQLMFASFIRIE